MQGLVNNLANPKMIAFFLALFPQFVCSEAGSLALQNLVLGSTSALMAVAWIGFVAVMVERFRAVVASSTAFEDRQRPRGCDLRWARLPIGIRGVPLALHKGKRPQWVVSCP